MSSTHNGNAVIDEVALGFVSLRPKLFGIAYRMLGSAVEAEDVVQDTWLRWQGTDRNVVRDPLAFLVTIATRLAINAVDSARKRRETYIGPWLPEPVDTTADPELGAIRAEALQFAILLLLEKLTANERAAYILRQAFDYSYGRIAEILDLTEPNVRQLVTRAKKHVDGGRQHQVEAVEQERLLRAFISAAQNGDLAGLEGLFSARVVSTSDGGGLVRASRVPVLGRERVAKFIAAVAGHFWTDTDLEWTEANSQPALIVSRGRAIIAVVVIDASFQGIDRILWLMNPDKLQILRSNERLDRRHGNTPHE